MGSSRFPKKVLYPLGNTVLLHYVYKRTNLIPSIDKVIVATSTSKKDDNLVRWCNQKNIEVYKGSENDLLERFLLCAKEYNADYIVRVTGDCPFISIDMAEELILKTIECKYDYGRIYPHNIPIGLKVSIMHIDTLKAISQLANHPYYREHITLYIDDHLSDFKVKNVSPPNHYLNKSYRLTVDTKEDLLLCQTIVKNLGEDSIIDSKKVVNFLDKNPDIAAINQSIKQKEYKV